MASSNNVCYYGRHFGCLNETHDAECRLCAERLAHAVDYVIHPTREAPEAHNVTYEDIQATH